MTPWQTLRTVRPPTLLDLASAVSVWAAWWMCDQFKPQVEGFVLMPVAMAILAKAVFGIIRVHRKAAHMMSSPSDRRFVYTLRNVGIVVIIVCASAPALLQDARLSQIGYTVFLAVFGVGHYGFACFGPGDIKAHHKDSPKAPDDIVAAYSIYGLALIGLALISIALIRMEQDALWVFAMSIGGVAYLYLARWVSVLWEITRRNAPQ